MYTHFWRSSPYPALIVFDAPNGNVTCTRRVRSNTPLQALTLANDVQFVECALALATDVMQLAPTELSERAKWLFRRCLARDPSPAELARLMQFVQQQVTNYEVDVEAADELLGPHGGSTIQRVELAAWSATARVLMNLDEFITRE